MGTETPHPDRKSGGSLLDALPREDLQGLYDHLGTIPYAPGSWSHNWRGALSEALAAYERCGVSRPALAVVRLSLRLVRVSLEQDEVVAERVEAGVAQALRDAGFLVERVDIEWLT